MDAGQWFDGRCFTGMRILLRNQETKLYYAGEDEWSPEPEKAVAFPSSLAAWRVVLRRPAGENLEVVYSFRDPEENLFTPIEPPSIKIWC